MFQFTERIEVDAAPNEIWRVLSNIEEWWPPSNPDHIDIEVKTFGNPVDVGTEVAFQERIAGVKGQAAGSITKWIPEREATWEGEAIYRYYGIPLRIQEYVSWRIERHGNTSQLSVHVRADFPSTLFGRLFEWYTKRFLDVVKRDREHARRELQYLKDVIEGAG